MAAILRFPLPDLEELDMADEPTTEETTGDVTGKFLKR